MSETVVYASLLRNGQGVIEETKTLLELWEPGMNRKAVYDRSLNSGYFPSLSARHLWNLIKDCFAPRYLIEEGYSASILKELSPVLSNSEFTQLLFLFTCRVTPILEDFVKFVYWNRYLSGHDSISNKEARQFFASAVNQGKTNTKWTESMISRVAADVTGCCGDFGLVERGSKSVRKIYSYRIESKVAAFLAHDLHFRGMGDNSLITAPDWKLFGMSEEDVVEELNRLSFKNVLIIQNAGDYTRLGWSYSDMEEFINGFLKR